VADEVPARDLVAHIAAFELRLQTRSPVFLIVVGIAALMVVGSLTVERLQVGPLRTGNRTSVEAVLMVHLVWSLFFLFTAAASRLKQRCEMRRLAWARSYDPRPPPPPPLLRSDVSAAHSHPFS
jgi:hypothetical protein